MRFLKCFWFRLNYSYCMTERYLASHRGDTMAMIHWSDQAYYWRRCYRIGVAL